jgi:hypothetical protein
MTLIGVLRKPLSHSDAGPSMQLGVPLPYGRPLSALEQFPFKLQLVVSHLNPGLHSPIAAENDLASQWVGPISEKIANAIVIRAAKKSALIQFIVAQPLIS